MRLQRHRDFAGRVIASHLAQRPDQLSPGPRPEIVVEVRGGLLHQPSQPEAAISGGCGTETLVGEAVQHQTLAPGRFIIVERGRPGPGKRRSMQRPGLTCQR